MHRHAVSQDTTTTIQITKGDHDNNNNSTPNTCRAEKPQSALLTFPFYNGEEEKLYSNKSQSRPYPSHAPDFAGHILQIEVDILDSLPVAAKVRINCSCESLPGF